MVACHQVGPKPGTQWGLQADSGSEMGIMKPVCHAPRASPVPSHRRPSSTLSHHSILIGEGLTDVIACYGHCGPGSLVLCKIQPYKHESCLGPLGPPPTDKGCRNLAGVHGRQGERDWQRPSLASHPLALQVLGKASGRSVRGGGGWAQGSDISK